LRIGKLFTDKLKRIIIKERIRHFGEQIKLFKKHKEFGKKSVWVLGKLIGNYEFAF